MLLAETGRTLLEHTWRAACGARRAAGVVVVTDSEEIAAAVRGFGGEAVMTSPECTSGTARIVEALPGLPAADVVVNVQGDEPELAASAIDAAIDLLGGFPEAGVATLVTPLRQEADLRDPAAVKAVLTPWPSGHGGTSAWRAIYFSRAAVPAARDWSPSLLAVEPPLYWQHVGLYAYRRRILDAWDALPESRLATIESLEQLRIVEAGIPIVAGAIDHAARGIDTPQDYARFVERCRARAGA
jgi:3-deoxy-manno-octulosonate cytidylyltransferase (CMP-KDO synthetase)